MSKDRIPPEEVVAIVIEELVETGWWSSVQEGAGWGSFSWSPSLKHHGSLQKWPGF